METENEWRGLTQLGRSRAGGWGRGGSVKIGGVVGLHLDEDGGCATSRPLKILHQERELCTHV